MKQIRWMGVFAIAVVCTVSAAWGQAAAGQAGGQPASQTAGQAAGQAAGKTSAASPAVPKPNPALRQLDYFAGVWSCTGTGYDDQGKGHPVVATATLRWELNGFFLGVHYQEKKTAANPMPIVDEEHWGYGEETKQFVAGVVDNEGGYGNKMTAGWDGAKLVWLGEYHTMGMKLPYRDAFTKKGDNELTDAGDIQVNGAWTKQFAIVCRRQAAK